MRYRISLFFLSTLWFLSSAEICPNPQIKAKSYTTQDATVVTNVAFISEFSLKCANNAHSLSLHAEVGGTQLPVVLISKDSYQVSWSELINKAPSGDYIVNIYDEDGFAALRKAQRNPEQATKVNPLGTIIVNFSGAYKGPWVNTEFLAAFVSVIVVYIAISTRQKLLS